MDEKMKKERHLIPIILAVVPIFGLLGGVLLVLENQETRRKAANEITLSLSAPTEVKVGDIFNANVLINSPSQKITSAKIVVEYPTEKIQAIRITNPNSFLPTLLEPGKINKDEGQATITLGCEPNNPQQGSGVIAQVQFLAIEDTNSAEIKINPETEIVSPKSDSPLLYEKTPYKLVILPRLK